MSDSRTVEDFHTEWERLDKEWTRLQGKSAKNDRRFDAVGSMIVALIPLLVGAGWLQAAHAAHMPEWFWALGILPWIVGAVMWVRGAWRWVRA